VLEPSAWVPLAEVARPHGVRGELRLRLFNRDSDLLLGLEEVLVRFPDGQEAEVSVDAARRANDAILMKLFSVDDRSGADDLRGAIVCARRDQFPPLEAGEFYACDLEGARVVFEDADTSTELGRVRAVVTYPTADVLVVESLTGGPPYEVPLLDSVVRNVDVERAIVQLWTLEGIHRQ
jgi:16S rRNA processing protein RimM